MTDYVASLCQVSVGVLFVYAASTKLRRLDAFVEGVRDYQIVPGRLAPVIGPGIAVTEVAIGVCHLSGAAIGAAALGGCIVLLIFVAAVVTNLNRRRLINCHCVGDETLSGRTLLRLAIVFAGELIIVMSVGVSRWWASPLRHAQTFSDILDQLIWSAVILQSMTWALNADKLLTLASRSYPSFTMRS